MRERSGSGVQWSPYSWDIRGRWGAVDVGGRGGGGRMGRISWAGLLAFLGEQAEIGLGDPPPVDDENPGDDDPGDEDSAEVRPGAGGSARPDHAVRLASS